MIMMITGYFSHILIKTDQWKGLKLTMKYLPLITSKMKKEKSILEKSIEIGEKIQNRKNKRHDI